MIQTVEESGLVILGTKTSSADLPTSAVGEALTARTKKKRVIKKDAKDMAEMVNDE
jgi:hypothetical protein